MSSTPPLIIDLDGSLLRGDSLHELVTAALGRPRLLAGAIRQFLTSGRASLKRYLAVNVNLDVALLPVNQEVLSLLRLAHRNGQPLYLATGADSQLADQVVARFPELAGRFASDGKTNLTGARKASVLVDEFGLNGFDYIGNSRIDRSVWAVARHSYLVTSRPATRGLPRWAQSVTFEDVLREPSRSAWTIWLKELRVHQSLKNVLLFLPILAAHAFGDARSIALLLAGFVAFSFMASSVYLLNDLLDIRSDRLHARKAMRPIAAGFILPSHALAASVGLAILAMTFAVAIGTGFALVLLGYAVLTCSYTFWLKRVTLVDVTILSMLYMIRLFAGAVIAGVALSFWFTGVALFMFLSLALVKRYTELSRPIGLDADHSLPGRGYTRSDAGVVLPLGIGAGTAALLLMAIYLQTDAVKLLYPSGIFLWLVIPAMFYWIGNIWIQAGRGNMHDDPIVFALKNRTSLVAGVVILALFGAASTPLALLIKQALARMGVQW